MNLNLWDILRRHYPIGEYVLMQEVRNGAGHYANRSADYMAFGLWPSRGLLLSGIEVKSFRSDWLRELKQPAKAEAFFQYCDYWWLLITDDTVAKLEEVPETWGLMCVKKDKIKILKMAPKLQPKDLDRGMFASMLKRCSEGMIPASSIADEVKKRAEEIASRNKDYELIRAQESIANYDTLRKQVQEFEIASGLSIRNLYRNVQKVGSAVGYLANDKSKSLEIHLDHTEQRLQRMLDDVKKSREELKNIPSLIELKEST